MYIYIHISYILNQWARDLNTYFRLGNCLIGYVKLTKNSDPDKYVNNGRGIGFNLPSEFSLPDGTVGKKCNYFWT